MGNVTLSGVSSSVEKKSNGTQLGADDGLHMHTSLQLLQSSRPQSVNRDTEQLELGPCVADFS